MVLDNQRWYGVRTAKPLSGKTSEVRTRVYEHPRIYNPALRGKRRHMKIPPWGVVVARTRATGNGVVWESLSVNHLGLQGSAKNGPHDESLLEAHSL